VYFTFFPHAHVHALLQPAVLAAIPGVLLNGTVPVTAAGIAGVRPNTSSEETLTRLAAQDSKVVP